MKYIFIILTLLTLIYNGLLYYVDTHIEDRITAPIYNNTHAIWSARGIYSSKEEQNSLLSFGKAFAVGYLGVEVDCYYDKLTDSFIISHDRKKKGQEGLRNYTLKEGKLLTLEELFNKLGKGHYFWIDYKNLDRLSKELTRKAIKRLDKISHIHNIKERLYLEGCTPNNLEEYTHAGYKTLFAFGPLKNNHLFSSISSNIYKIAYYFYDVTAIAIHYGDIDNPKYGKDSQTNLKGIPTFLFHVPNDENLLRQLLQNKEIRVLLVGRDISVNRAKMTKQHLKISEKSL